jgi:hypothetical protein
MCQRLHWDSVHEPDPRLVLWVRQVAVAACVDGFVWEQWVAAGCMTITNPDAVTTRPSLHAYYPRILLMLDQGATAWARRVFTLYIHGLCQRSGL